MALPPADRQLITETLDREPTDAEAALFENLWSEHCAYRSSMPLLGAFESDGERVVVGPGDDAAVVSITDEWYLAFGIESHNHPSYVDPYDGAATGVGGIVRDVLSMGGYPIALADCLYFGPFDDEHSQYLFEGVVEGIADYGNAIGVPTVGGGVHFDPGYTGNPLVNVACVGLLSADRLMQAAATTPGNKLIIVGNATGRDGLGGASFASEDLAEDAETADRPAVQVGDPYAEKLLIEANEAILDAGLAQAARDLGAAGLGGATSEMVAKGGLGASLTLEQLHQREPNMVGLELLLAESQERMCYEVRPDDVDAVLAIADRYELGHSVIGEVTDDGRYRCTFEGTEIVDVPVAFLADGAPFHQRAAERPAQPEPTAIDLTLSDAVETVLRSPNTASKRWVFRQYDHEVGVRTTRRPGDDAAILAIPETGHGLAIAAGAEPKWTTADPHEGAKAVALEVATNLAVKGAEPIAAVDCLNGGNPEKPDVFHGFAGIVDGLADMCQVLSVPVVGGNVSLYNDSPAGPIPPTPTLTMIGLTEDFTAPPRHLGDNGEVLLVGPRSTALGGAEVLAGTDDVDAFPTLPDDPLHAIETLRTIARHPDTVATHDISHGGLAVTLAEMVTADTGVDVTLDSPVDTFVSERPGRAIVQTTDPAAVRDICDGHLPITSLGQPTANGVLSLAGADDSVAYPYETIVEFRDVIDRVLG